MSQNNGSAQAHYDENKQNERAQGRDKLMVSNRFLAPKRVDTNGNIHELDAI